MPIYCYACKKCGAKREETVSMDMRADFVRCECGGNMSRDYNAERPNANGTEKGDTFWSQSLAINPSQIAEHRRLFPDVEVRADGCLGFNSNAVRERYCDATGFYKEPGKSKRNSKQLTPAKLQAT